MAAPEEILGQFLGDETFPVNWDADAEKDFFWAPVNTVAEVVADAQTVASGALVQVSDGTYDRPMVATPVEGVSASKVMPSETTTMVPRRLRTVFISTTVPASGSVYPIAKWISPFRIFGT